MTNSYTCQNGCLYRTYLLQALVRKCWLEMTITTLRILSEIENITGRTPRSRWGLFNPDETESRIEAASNYLRQVKNDITMIENTLTIGCMGCFPN